MGNKLKRVNISIMVVMLVLFIFLLYCNITQDAQDATELNGIVCHKEITLPKIKNVDRLMIESVTEEYLRKRSINKSNCAKIWSEIKTGIFRGALGGAIVGGGWDGAASGAIVFGSMAGLFRSYDLIYGKSVVLKNNV
jgi:hypothetical protein